MDLVIMGILGLGLIACSGPSQTIPLSVSTHLVQAPANVPSALRVAVVPFEDMRTDKTKIGQWQHYFETRVDRLVPAQGSSADQITGFVADYLELAGFQVVRVKPGESVVPGTADVVLTGEIQWYWNMAVSDFLWTELSTRNVLMLKAANAADGSTVRILLDGQGATTVVLFDLDDLAMLDSETLGQTLARFLADVVVESSTLKAKK